MAPQREMKILEDFVKNEEYKKVILEVIKARLELGWPYNYKALDVLSLVDPGDLLPLLDSISKLHESPPGTEGGPELKKLAKPLVEKANGEKAKQEEEAAKKQQEAIAAMWGGLWHNAPPAQAPVHAAGWTWAYPWAGPPGVAAAGAAVPAWNGVPPEGWTPWVLTPVPMPAPAPHSPPLPYGGYAGYGYGGYHPYGGCATHAHAHAHGGVAFQRWPHERS